MLEAIPLMECSLTNTFCLKLFKSASFLFILNFSIFTIEIAVNNYQITDKIFLGQIKFFMRTNFVSRLATVPKSKNKQINHNIFFQTFSLLSK